MPTTDLLATLNPSIIGRAEKAHAAFLKPLLAGTMLDEPQWITLQLAVGAGETIQESELVSRVAGAAQYDKRGVEAAIAALRKASLTRGNAFRAAVGRTSSSGSAILSTTGSS